MAKFKVGDVVELKSGGPKMTIIELPSDRDSRYTCQWFVEENIKGNYFYEDTIKIVEDNRTSE